MATLFYFPSAGTAAVSPAISGTDWGHINAVRRPLNSVKGSSAVATTAFAPDAADHLVNARSHVCQFVSEVLPPQTIAAQVVKLVCRCAEDNAGNNLFLNWKITAVSEDGQTVLGTLIAVKADGLEVAATLTNRVDTATTTAFESAVNFRFVIELGLGGTPTAATGTQGHNGSISFGEAAALDLPENDTATTADNPWLQFTGNVKFWNPPVPPQGWARVEVALAKGDPASPAGWQVTQVLFSTLFPFEARWRIGRLFLSLAQMIDWDHDDIMVLMTNVNLSVGQIDRIREIRDRRLPTQKVCLLENGLRLSDLTPAQISARVG